MTNVALSAVDNLDDHFLGERITLGELSSKERKKASREAVTFPYAELYFAQKKYQEGSPIDSDESDDDCVSDEDNDELHDTTNPPLEMSHPAKNIRDS
ncbi:hypothetical protein EV175_007171, partial [Coemansia sp. RSA 1933]